MWSRRIAHALALAALLIALVPCPPAQARGACGMSGACPMRTASGVCRTAHSTGFDCCKSPGERTPTPVSPAPGAPGSFVAGAAVTAVLVVGAGVAFAASFASEALESPPQAYGRVHRFTLLAVFLI